MEEGLLSVSWLLSISHKKSRPFLRWISLGVVTPIAGANPIFFPLFLLSLDNTNNPPGRPNPSFADFMVSITTEYISVGGNRHPAAADWDVQSGILAYGADNNVALWDPLVCEIG